jgi:DNA polymerase
MNEEKYFKMVETFLLAKNYLKQQVELGEEEIFKTKKNSEDPLKNFYKKIRDCHKCPLHKSRTNFVFGKGNPNSKIMFIGEAPGREEDLKGEPFVGAAGQLLDKILTAIKFQREDIYITNVLKCRPPENRDPLPEEMEKCEPYLLKQIEIINPKLICALGRISAQALLKTKLPLNKLRGRFHDYNGIKLLVTYHPAALLRYPQYKKETWEDVQLLKKEYNSLVGE